MFYWADAALVLAAIACGYVLLLRRVRLTLREHQREIDHRLRTLTETIALLEMRLAEPEAMTDSHPTREIDVDSKGVAPANPDEPEESLSEREEIPPEIEVAIAAAAFAVLGPHARVRSTKMVHNVVSPWTQQGRVSVQASHNLRVRR